jgi:hypothetical protein
VTTYSWYEEVAATEPLLQGDIIASCPISTFTDLPDLSQITEIEGLKQSLRASIAVEEVRAIVMTQACDMAQRKVPNVIPCPIQPLSEHKAAWEQASEASRSSHGTKQWESYLKRVKDGLIWHLAVLNGRQEPAGINIEVQIVDFHEVLSLPLRFLEAWVQRLPGNRLRLCPPYREHLSQAFARFFMRVGLPEDINL